MIILRTLFRAMVIAVIFFLAMIYFYSDTNYDEPLHDNNIATPPKFDDDLIDEHQHEDDARPDEGLSIYIGKSVDALIDDYGEPQRIDPSAYGYEWWIYKNFSGTYMQVGIRDDSVVTIYAIGNQLNVFPYTIGQSIEDIYRTTVLETEIVVSIDDGSYRFELSEEDLNIRPLIGLGNIYAQLFIDKYTGTLSSIRFYDKKTLVTLQPYEMVYRGDLLEPSEIADYRWRGIEKGTEQQIFDITNIMRARHGLQKLEWDDVVSDVAFQHSKDMYENEYFSHESPVTGSLSERLDAEEIEYEAAAENIAMEYVDAPAVVEGWINSEGHRSTLLDENYSGTGVGVYRKYYTQNFINQKK